MSQTQPLVTSAQRQFLDRVGLTVEYSVETNGGKTVHVASLRGPDGSVKLIGKNEDLTQLIDVALSGYTSVYGSDPLPRVYVEVEETVATEVATEVTTEASPAETGLTISPEAAAMLDGSVEFASGEPSAVEWVDGPEPEADVEPLSEPASVLTPDELAVVNRTAAELVAEVMAIEAAPSTPAADFDSDLPQFR